MEEIKRFRNALVKNEAEEALQAKIRLMNFIENAVEQNSPSEKVSIKGIRGKRQSEKRKNHKNIEEVIKNG